MYVWSCAKSCVTIKLQMKILSENTEGYKIKNLSNFLILLFFFFLGWNINKVSRYEKKKGYCLVDRFHRDIIEIIGKAANNQEYNTCSKSNKMYSI